MTAPPFDRLTRYDDWPGRNFADGETTAVAPCDEGRYVLLADVERLFRASLFEGEDSCPGCGQEVPCTYSCEVNEVGDFQPGCGSGGHMSVCKVCHDVFHGLVSVSGALRAIAARQSHALAFARRELGRIAREVSDTHAGLVNALEHDGGR